MPAIVPLIKGFGAVKLTSASGWKLCPAPQLGGPVSMFHDEGASTDVTGTFDCANASMTGPNGALISPEKLKPLDISISKHYHYVNIPNIASTTWSASLNACWKSSTNGTSRLSNWADSRFSSISTSRHSRKEPWQRQRQINTCKKAESKAVIILFTGH